MEDQELIMRIQSDPEQGLEVAMRLYTPMVKAIIYRYVGADYREDMKECIADVFIRVWRFIDQFDGEKGSLRGYIAVITRNEVLRRLKKEGKSLGDLSLEELEIGIEVDMVGEIGRKINAQIVQEVISNLPEPDRQIFISRYFWGDRIKAISQMLGLEDKFVENRLYLVKKRLRGRLLEKGVIL